jgi:SAM-dependent methyltransferase
MIKFHTQTMLEITSIIEQKLNKIEQKDILEFEILNPDCVTSTYSGKKVSFDNTNYIYRSYRAWNDLATIHKCKMLTPIINSKHTVIMRFEKLNQDANFHKLSDSLEYKYGADSIFSLIQKNEEPAFLHYYKQALKNVNINKRTRILNLGINSGDEFELIRLYASEFESLELVGIDYCPSAIQKAKNKFIHNQNITLYTHDINNLNSLNLGKFDLIISIGTLQSSNIEFNPLFMSIVQNQLKKDGAMILGFPNCRWIDGEMIYGARVKHYSFAESSLLYKDVIFCKKYLQQKKFRVTITGKEYIFLTATSICKA